MDHAARIYIIGIGDDGLEGLTKQALERVRDCQLLVGPQSLLEKVDPFRGRKEPIGTDLDRMANLLEHHSNGTAVVLASGDPLFYGTARFLYDRLGRDRFEVVPHVSSMQLAFARVKENWDEAYLTNVATQPIDRIIERIRTAEKVGLFTSESIPPAKVAELLLLHGLDYFSAYVCENLGSPDERVTRASLAEIQGQRFSLLNVMILVRKPGVPDRPTDLIGRRLFGNPDELFLQSKPKRGLLTPSEVRCIAIAELQLRPASLVWDVGAGSGSVAIEAAQIASAGRVFAIEMDAEDYNMLVENAKRFGALNITPVLGEAPQAWKSLPDPDSVFVGGTGRAVCDLVQAAWQRLRPGGTLVANLSSLENVANLQTLLNEKLGADAKVLMVQLSHGTYQLERTRLESRNPSFLVTASKAK